jgi:hypothetical protein
MAHRCKPTIEYEIESVNFLEQLLNAKNKYWNETLYLGDLITLYDNEVNKEEVLFFVGYTLNPMDKALEIKLSNKKLDTTSTKKISELLTKTKRVTKKINKNQYLWNRVKNQ